MNSMKVEIFCSLLLDILRSASAFHNKVAFPNYRKQQFFFKFFTKVACILQISQES